MEQDGGASEPNETEPEQEDPGGSPPEESPPSTNGTGSDGPRRLLVIGGAVAAVAVIAAIAFTVGGDGDLASPPVSDDDELGITLPTGDSSTSVAATTPETPAPTPAPTPGSTEVPPTTLVPTTAPPATATPTSAGPTTVGPTTTVASSTTTIPGATAVPTSTVPPTGAAVSIDSIVPDIAASPRHLSSPQAVQATIDELLESGGRHDVALPGRVDTLCATVELDGPIELSGRWERDGDVIAESSTVLRSAPGFGDCIDNDGGPLDPGSYQYLATDVDGTDSAAANFVVGGVRVDQQFVNNGDEPVCAVFVAPSTSDYFEDFVFASPLPPAASVVIPIADVPQDVEVLGCVDQIDDRVVSDFDFNPTRGEPQALFP